MMTHPLLVVSLTCVLLARMTDLSPSLHQDKGFISAEVGESVTLPCFSGSKVVARYYWYKQSLGQKPRLISSFLKHSLNGTFHNEFNNNPRFTLDTENYLTISDIRNSDSATYYCVHFLYTLDVSESIFVSVRDSGLSIQAQSVSETIQPGDSVTLKCTVQTGNCDGERSVHWFKKFEQSSPGLIYTHGGRNNQRDKKPDAQTHTCVFDIPVKSQDRSDAGTHYCAVASCGHILFGNGTKLDFDDTAELVYFWSRASAFTTILSVILAICLCMMTKRNYHSADSLPAPSTAYAEGYQRAGILYYAALSVNLTKRSRKHTDKIWSESVYYRVNR